MRNVTRPAGRTEAVQSMLGVWMAISAVWIVFWLLIATLVLATEQVRSVFDWQPGACALVLLLPPVGLLMIGAMGRWAYLGFAAERSRDHDISMHPAER